MSIDLLKQRYDVHVKEFERLDALITKRQKMINFLLTGSILSMIMVITGNDSPVTTIISLGCLIGITIIVAANFITLRKYKKTAKQIELLQTLMISQLTQEIIHEHTQIRPIK